MSIQATEPGLNRPERLGWFRAILGAVNAGASQIAHAALWLLTAVVLWDVLWRSLGAPTIWGAEVSVYLMMALAFLGIGHTWAEDGHFRVTLLVDWLPHRAQLAIEFLCTILALLFAIAFMYGAYRLAAFSFQLNFTTPTVLKVPLGLLQGLVFLGGLSLVFALLQDLIRILRGKLRPVHTTDIWAA